MRPTPMKAMLLLAVGLAACGSDKKEASGTTPASSSEAPSGSAAAETTDGKMRREALDNDGSGAQMAHQSTMSASEQADMSEAATTGTDDNAGSEATPKSPSAAFAYVLQGGAGFTGTPDAPNAAYTASLNLQANKYGNASVDGNLVAQVVPTPLPVVGLAANTNMSMNMVFELNHLLANGDVTVVQSEPNMTVTKVGRRAAGLVMRTLTGTERRTLRSAADANASFDLLITHAGTTVVDTYAAGQLKTRTLNGTTAVQNQLTGETAQLTYDNVSRTQKGCLCPSSGSMKMLVTAKDGTVGSYAYDFTAGNGTCGAVSLSLTTTATAAATAAINALATDANATFSGKASISGSLAWSGCAVTP